MDNFPRRIKFYKYSPPPQQILCQCGMGEGIIQKFPAGRPNLPHWLFRDEGSWISQKNLPFKYQASESHFPAAFQVS